MPERADRVCRFIEEFLTLSTGDPFILPGWQKRFLADFYSPGVTRGLLSVAKKNGKTELAGGLVLVHVAGPEAKQGPAGARIVSAAAGSREQAGMVFSRAQLMTLQSPALQAVLKITPSRMRIQHQTRLNRYDALPAKARTVHGELPFFWIYDELAQALDSDLYDALDRGQGTLEAAGREGRGLVISTRSHRPGNPMTDLIDAVSRGQALGGMRHWALHVYSADPDAEDEFEWGNVAAANPALGSFLAESAVQREVEEARLMPSKRASFRAYRLNIESEATDALVDLHLWAKATDPDCGDAQARAAALEALEGEVCVAGLDLSSSLDLTSLALWFPQHRFLAVRSWLPEALLAEREMDDRVPYREWHREGDLDVMPGATIEPEGVVEVLDAVCNRFDVRQLRYDRWRMAPVKKLFVEKGVSLALEPFGQGYKDMGPAIEEFERLVHNRQLRHDGNPVTNYCMGGCLTVTDPTSSSDARKPVKRKGARNDAAIAALMAISDRGLQFRPKTAEDFLAVRLYDDVELGEEDLDA